jgi:copper chaperone CopZ
MISFKKAFSLLFFVSILSMSVSYAGGDKVKKKIKVWGNCGLCNKVIVTTAKSIDGVLSAKWNSETKMMVVKYKSDLTYIDEIQKKIASVGYDTEKYKADDEVYENLHYCCKYDRN